jgi:hypothetical protein
MKLVCLEIVIVSIATRAAFALLDKPPPVPDALWAGATLLAAIVAAGILVYDATVAHRPVRVHPPHIPLDRIGPYRDGAVAVRSDGRDRRVNLN